MTRWLSFATALLLLAVPAAADDPAPAGTGRGPAVLFVYDASGSMLRKVEGKAKDAVARQVMTGALQSLTPNARVGLLTFGHRRKNDCTDLEMLAPIGTDRAVIAKDVNAIKPKGETPLAESVRMAVEQIKSEEGDASVVLVTDGKDECGGDPCAATREAIAAGVHVRFHVVGFDVSRDQAAQLQCIAREGKGKYFSASNASQLGRAIEEVGREVNGAAEKPVKSPSDKDCPSASTHRGETKPFSCECDAEAVKHGSVWGTELYTDDSGICRAAVHAGVIPATGGKVTVYPYGGQDSYDGSEKNGIYSSDYGMFDGSFGFKEGLKLTTGGCPPSLAEARGAVKNPLSCTCTAKAAEDGSVWGTDVYTYDSSICHAAVHAGIIKAEGGPVTVYPQPGRISYDGEERNGVSSRDYGHYDRSFSFTDKIATQDVVRCPGSLAEASQSSLTCSCREKDTERGGVWGTDVYTKDSSICGAAVHAGVIPATGGTVKVKASPGRGEYNGTHRNGKRSSDYGAYDGSMEFEK